MMKHIKITGSRYLLRRRHRHIIMFNAGQSICIPSLFQSALFSNDSRRDRQNNLRSLRKGRPLSGSGEETVDYRYRGGSESRLGEQLDQSVEELWGGAIEEEASRREINRNKPSQHKGKQMAEGSRTEAMSTPRRRPNFISFFDEVDAKMGLGSLGPNKNLKKVTSSIGSRREKDVIPKKSESSSSSSSSSIDRLFDALNKDSRPTSTLEVDSKPQSIFDAFPLKPKKKDDPNAYETESFGHYYEAMKQITESDKFMRKHTNTPIREEVLRPVIDWLLKEKKTLDYDYGVLRDSEADGISVSPSSISDEPLQLQKKAKKMKKAFRNEVLLEGTEPNRFYAQLKDQNQSFLETTKLSEQQLKLAEKALSVLASNCAKMAKSIPLSIAWKKMKEAGMIPTNDTLNVLLYATGTMTSSFLSSRISSNNKLNAVMSILGDGVNKKKDEDNVDDNPIDFPTELAIFHDLLYPPTEKSVSLRVKRLVSTGDASRAEQLLDSFPSDEDAKLRTYLPVLKLYCDQGNVTSALRLFKRMRDEPCVRLEPENYVLLISTIAQNGYFNNTSQALEGAKEVGYQHDYGAKFFDELATEMAEDVLEITGASARRLYNSLAVGMNHDEFSNDIEPIHSLAGVAQDSDPATPNDLIASRVAIEKSTGQCPRSGVKLRLIKLKEHERKQLHSGLLELSEDRFEEFHQVRNQGPKHSQWQNNAAAHLNRFSQWLDEREGEPFTAIIDGANIAYYMQNFDSGCFNYHQIQFVVDALEKSNENPLVILPTKYFSSSFYINMGSRGFKQVSTKEDKQIMQKLRQKKQVYQVPARCLDDYYWMLASVSNQTRSRNNVDLDVPSDNAVGRWPGTRPMLITNDQMRDHKLGLMEPRLFRRWTSCYIVNYSFTAFVRAESLDREISFSTADFFSREIQKNETSSGTVWHFPVSDWDFDDRLCLRL